MLQDDDYLGGTDVLYWFEPSVCGPSYVLQICACTENHPLYLMSVDFCLALFRMTCICLDRRLRQTAAFHGAMKISRARKIRAVFLPRIKFL